MKNTKKGLTLVEVLVAISVFTIIIFSLFTSIAAMRKVVSRQEEAVRIKMACQDMIVYYNDDAEDWKGSYFGNEFKGDTGYLTSKFVPTVDQPVGEDYYSVIFKSEGIDIVSNDGRVLVENLQLPLKED